MFPKSSPPLLLALCTLAACGGGYPVGPVRADSADVSTSDQSLPNPGVSPTPKALSQVAETPESGPLPPIDSPALAGGPTPGLIYDTPLNWRPAFAPLLVASRRPGDGNLPGSSCIKGNASFCPDPPMPPDPLPDVPGPAGVLGAAAAFGWARRMRRRVRL